MNIFTIIKFIFTWFFNLSCSCSCPSSTSASFRNSFPIGLMRQTGFSFFVKRLKKQYNIKISGFFSCFFFYYFYFILFYYIFFCKHYNAIITFNDSNMISFKLLILVIAIKTKRKHLKKYSYVRCDGFLFGSAASRY